MTREIEETFGEQQKAERHKRARKLMGKATPKREGEIEKHKNANA